jgi:hypothetical protein
MGIAIKGDEAPSLEKTAGSGGAGSGDALP